MRPLLPFAWHPAGLPPDRWFPVGALILPGGGLVVAERFQNRIYLLPPSAPDPLRLPSPDRGPVEWTALSAAPGLGYYVLDGPGRKVQQYDLSGNYVGLALDLEALAQAEGLGGIEPGGLAVDRTGRAVVTDRLADRLLEFGPGWSFLGEWGEGGSAPGTWRRPGAVAVGRKPPFLVADEGNLRVVLVDEFGGAVATRELSKVPRGVAVTEEGRYAVAYGDVVEILDTSLSLLERVRIPEDTAGCDGTPFVTTALAGDGGTVYVGEGCSGRVLELRRPEK